MADIVRQNGAFDAKFGQIGSILATVLLLLISCVVFEILMKSIKKYIQAAVFAPPRFINASTHDSTGL